MQSSTAVASPISQNEKDPVYSVVYKKKKAKRDGQRKHGKDKEKSRKTNKVQEKSRKTNNDKEMSRKTNNDQEKSRKTDSNQEKPQKINSDHEKPQKRNDDEEKLQRVNNATANQQNEQTNLCDEPVYSVVDMNFKRKQRRCEEEEEEDEEQPPEVPEYTYFRQVHKQEPIYEDAYFVPTTPDTKRLVKPQLPRDKPPAVSGDMLRGVSGDKSRGMSGDQLRGVTHDMPSQFNDDDYDYAVLPRKRNEFNPESDKSNSYSEYNT